MHAWWMLLLRYGEYILVFIKLRESIFFFVFLHNYVNSGKSLNYVYMIVYLPATSTASNVCF